MGMREGKYAFWTPAALNSRSSQAWMCSQMAYLGGEGDMGGEAVRGAEARPFAFFFFFWGAGEHPGVLSLSPSLPLSLLSLSLFSPSHHHSLSLLTHPYGRMTIVPRTGP